MAEHKAIESTLGKELGESEIKSPGCRVMVRIAKANLWRDHIGNDGEWNYIWEIKDRFTDRDRVNNILKEELKPDRGNHYEGELPELSILNEASKRLTNSFVASAVKDGWLPMEVVMLTSKITRGSDIKVVDNSLIGLNYDTGGRPDVSISENIIRNRMSLLMNAAKKVDIELTPKQAMTGAITAVAAHEYAHSTDRAMEKKFVELAISLPGELGEKSKDELDISNFGHALTARAAESIVTKLFSNLSSRWGDSNSIHSERLATGFEFEGFKHGLISTGVDSKKAEEMVELMRKDRYGYLVEISSTIDKLSMEQVSLTGYSLDLKQAARELDLPDSYVPYLWADVGYFAGYTKEQMKPIMEGALNALDGSKAKDLVAEIIQKRGTWED